MKLEHSFSVAVSPEEAWPVLLDVRRIAPCMPGTTIDTVDGDDFTGKVKVKVGPITVTYSGNASFTEKDEAARRAVIVAKGKETRGSGTAQATVTGTLRPEGTGTRVDVVTDLAITGKPAQFGRGVMAEVGAKLIGQFADCLEAELTGPAPEHGTPTDGAAPTDGPAPTAPPDTAPVTATPSGTFSPVTPSAAAPAAAQPEPAPQPAAAVHPQPPSATRPTPEAIDLLQTAGAPLAKRVAPILAFVAVAVAALVVLRRRRS